MCVICASDRGRELRPLSRPGLQIAGVQVHCSRMLGLCSNCIIYRTNIPRALYVFTIAHGQGYLRLDYQERLLRHVDGFILSFSLLVLVC